MKLLAIILCFASVLGAQALPLGTSYTPFGVKSRNQGPNWTTGAAATCSYNANKFDIGGYPLNEEVGQCTTGFVQALTGSVLVPAISTRETHSAGVAGYAKTLSSNPGGGAVGVFGLGVLGAVSGAWGANFSCNTFATGGGNHVGNCWGIEVDMNAHGPPQPAPANMWGITVVSSFYQQAAQDTVGVKIQRAITSNAKWKVGFETQQGSVDIGLQLGPTDETAQAGSAPINFLARDASLASRQATISLDDAVNMRYMADGVHSFSNSGLTVNYASIRSTGILPGTNDAQDLGSSAPLVRWRNLYSTYAFLTSTGFEPTATNTYLLGSNGLRWAVAYGVEADFAPLAIAGSNSKTTLRRLRLADDVGATTFWDVRSNSNSTTSDFVIRDSAGTPTDYLTLRRVAGGVTDNRAILSANFEPATTAIYNVGSSSTRWGTIYGGSIDVAPNSVTGNFVATRHLRLVDSSATDNDFWDISARATTASDISMVFKDDTGSSVLELMKINSGSTVNEATFWMSVMPSAGLTWDLGKSGTKWRHTYTSSLTLDTTGTLSIGPNIGLTQTVTVRNAADTGSCTLVFTLGIKTGGTC